MTGQDRRTVLVVDWGSAKPIGHAVDVWASLHLWWQWEFDAGGTKVESTPAPDHGNRDPNIIVECQSTITRILGALLDYGAFLRFETAPCEAFEHASTVDIVSEGSLADMLARVAEVVADDRNDPFPIEWWAVPPSLGFAARPLLEEHAETRDPVLWRRLIDVGTVVALSARSDWSFHCRADLAPRLQQWVEAGLSLSPVPVHRSRWQLETLEF